VEYPLGEAGSTQSFSFALTQTKYYAQDVYGAWYWQYYSPVPQIPLLTGFWWFDGWHYFPNVPKLPGITGELKRDKIHSAGDVESQQSQELSGGVSLPELGSCDEEVTSSAPTFVDPTCADGSVGLTTPNDEGVLYTTEGTVEPGGSVTVTASAEEGYVLSEEAQTEWEHTYPATAEGCTPPPPPCTFVGADKDGGKDKFGGTNDECAAGPDQPTTLVSTPPAVSAPLVVAPSVMSPPTTEKPKATPKAKKKPKAKPKALKPKLKAKPKHSKKRHKAAKTH
jgi:hypothetical protein